MPHPSPARGEPALDEPKPSRTGVTSGPTALPDVPAAPAPPVEMPPVPLGSTVSDQPALAPPIVTSFGVSPPDAPASESVALTAPPSSEDTEAVSLLDPADDTAPLDHSSTPFNLDDGVTTELGGIFYLVNLMCYLDLPDMFEQDWRLASLIGPWGVLELLGRGLIGRSTVTNDMQGPSAYADDALWPLLAHLAGRDIGTLPGADHPGAPEVASVHLPANWLQKTPSDARAGFSHAPVDPLHSHLLRGLNPHLRPWLAAVLPFVRRRLQLALGLSADADDLTADVLARPARIYATATHVDVVMRLDTVTLPIRLAGLDRDPGWLPDFGRVIKLHFE